MKQTPTYPMLRSALAALLLLLMGATTLQAQPAATLSRNADFSTDDRVFERTDMLHMRIIAPQVDFSDLDENAFRLKPDDGGNDVHGTFTNHFDGTYTATLSLESTDPAVSDWEWRARIKDDSGHEFEARLHLVLGDANDQDGGGNGGGDDGGGDDGGDDDDRDDGDGEQNEVELTGAIEALQADGLTVAGTFFLVTDQTAVLDGDNRPILYSDLAVGLIVEVEADIQADGSLVARKIKLEDEEDGDDEVEMRGTIEALGIASVTVNGLTFLVTDQTTVLDRNNNPIPFSDLTLGTFVEIEGDVQADGSLVARKIKLEDDDADEIEVTGVLDALSPTAISVNGLAFDVTAQTLVLDHNNQPISLDDLALGMLVEVEGTLGAGGALVARKIKIEDRGDDEVELTGTITDVGRDFIAVSGLLIYVDAGTVVLDEDAEPIPFGALGVEMLVEVQAVQQPDGRLRATRIKQEDRLEDEVEVQGAIESRPGLATVMVLGRSIRLLPTTVIVDDRGTRLPADALQVGDPVTVRGDLLPGGDLLALLITKGDAVTSLVQVAGPLEAITADSLWVLGIAFAYDASTRFLDDDGNPVPAARFRPGKSVAVTGLEQQDGTHLATQVQVTDVVVMTGAFTDVQRQMVTLLGTPVAVTERTLFLGDGNQVLDPATLAPGQVAQVRSLAGGPMLVATKIKVFGVTGTTTATEDAAEVPARLVLHQNYPNPFNPTTTITFDLSGAAQPVSLTVYNLLGQAVATLVEDVLPAGTHHAAWDGRGVPSGVYLYRLRAGNTVQTRTMLLLK